MDNEPSRTDRAMDGHAAARIALARSIAARIDARRRVSRERLAQRIGRRLRIPQAIFTLLLRLRRVDARRCRFASGSRRCHDDYLHLFGGVAAGGFGFPNRVFVAAIARRAAAKLTLAASRTVRSTRRR
jgi:hypothetical protein